MDYAGNASFTLRPTTVNADLPAGQMASLIEEDMKRMLEPECESRYFAFYYTMLEKKMPYLPFDINSMWCAHPVTFIINNCLKFNISIYTEWTSGRALLCLPGLWTSAILSDSGLPRHRRMVYISTLQVLLQSNHHLSFAY